MLRRLPLAAVAVVTFTGCPGSIDDPAPFFSATASSCPSDFQVEADLFVASCGQLGCHQGGDVAAAGLDLRSEGVRDRLLAHTSAECDDRPLIDPSDFENSYMLLKVGDAPPCGQRMPSNDPPLTATERLCLEEYLADLAGVSLPDASVPEVDGGSEPPGMDAGAGDPDAGGEPLEAITYQAESDFTLSGYEVDGADATVVRIIAGQTSGTATRSFDGAPGRYTLTAHAVAEPDGQPTLRVYVAGALVREATYPLASGTEHEPYALEPVEVTLAAGDEIRLEGEADTVDADAWARLDRVGLTP